MINKINITNWKEYKVSDLFTIKGCGSISINDILQNGYGDYPYITRTQNNNGISGFFDYKTVCKNVLTIETTLSGLCFYHNYEFSTGDHIMVLFPKEHTILNEYTAMFIKTIWGKNSYKYDYARPAIKENIENTFLILPSKNNQPDWQCMENYIKSLQQKIKFKPIYTKNKSIQKLNTKDWKEFKIKNLFKVYGSKTTKLLDLENYGYGEYPYITTQATNNGIAGFYDFYTEKKNVLTIDSAVIGFVSYQDKEFSASDHVEILEPLENTILNKYTALFLITILNKETYRYSYGRKFNQTNIKNTIIKLPAIKNINNEYQPDWQYMENYIKNLPYGDLI